MTPTLHFIKTGDESWAVMSGPQNKSSPLSEFQANSLPSVFLWEHFKKNSLVIPEDKPFNS